VAAWEGGVVVRRRPAAEETRLGRLSDVPDRTLAPLQWGTLEVTTTGMKAGYLRKNGVPYGENAGVTEYFDRHPGPGGAEWFAVTTIVDDRQYLAESFITSSHFRARAGRLEMAPDRLRGGPATRRRPPLRQRTSFRCSREPPWSSPI
jgi:hypothetical protein